MLPWSSAPNFFQESSWEEDEGDENEFRLCRNDTRRWCLKVFLQIIDEEAKRSKKIVKYRKRISKKTRQRIQDRIRNDY